LVKLPQIGGDGFDRHGFRQRIKFKFQQDFSGDAADAFVEVKGRTVDRPGARFRRQSRRQRDFGAKEQELKPTRLNKPGITQ